MRPCGGHQCLMRTLENRPSLALFLVPYHLGPIPRGRRVAVLCCQANVNRLNATRFSGLHKAEVVEKWNTRLCQNLPRRQGAVSLTAVAKEIVFDSAVISTHCTLVQSGCCKGDGEGQHLEHLVADALPIQVVGFGYKVPAIFKFCHDSAVLPSADFWIVSKDGLLLEHMDLTPQRQEIPMQKVGRMCRTESKTTPILSKNCGCFFLLKAGNAVGLETATSLLHEARKQCQLAVSIVVLPFYFEGPKRRREAQEVLEKLKTSSNLVLVVEQDAFLEQDDLVTVSEAGFLVCTAVQQGMKAISEILWVPGVELAAGSKISQYVQRPEVYQILVQGGNACVGFGRGNGVKAAVEAASLDSPFVRGWLAELQGSVLCTLACASNVEPEGVEDALWLLRCLVGPKVQLVCMPIRDPSLDAGAVSATIILTGLESNGGALSPVHMNQRSSILEKLVAFKNTTTENTVRTWTVDSPRVSPRVGEQSDSAITKETVGIGTSRVSLRDQDENSDISGRMKITLDDQKSQKALQQCTTLIETEPLSNGVLPFEGRDRSRMPELANSDSDNSLDPSHITKEAVLIAEGDSSSKSTCENLEMPAVLTSSTSLSSSHRSGELAEYLIGAGTGCRHQSRSFIKPNVKSISQRSEIPSAETPNALINVSTEKCGRLIVMSKKNGSSRKNGVAISDVRLKARDAQLPGVISKENHLQCAKISWRAGPSSAVAEAWARSRAEVQKGSSRTSFWDEVHSLDGEGALGVHMGIRPRNEQQREVIRRSAPMEVVPCDPAAVPRSGMGFVFDIYRLMLQGENKKNANSMEEIVSQTSLSKRAASMLESERRQKLTPVVENVFDQGVYKGHCLAGLPHGKGLLNYNDGSFYDGEWKNGKREGNGSFYYANGDVFQGSWLDDVKHGQGWIYFHNGDRLFADYVKGRADGEARLYSAGGNVFFGHFRDNWRHGDCLFIESSGLRWREIWDYGVLLSKTLSGKDTSQTVAVD